MLVSLLIAQVLLLAPHCVLTAGIEHRQGRGPLEAAGITAQGFTRGHYQMVRGPQRVVGRVTDSPALASLSWQPPGGTLATLTCTQRDAGPRPPVPGLAIVVCALDARALRSGVGAVDWIAGDQRWRASSTGHELRVEVTSDALGFAAAWREAEHPAANALTLTAGGHSMTCWRH